LNKMPGQKALQLNQFYHIYHRGNNRSPIFFEERNYRHFLNLYIKYIEPVAFTYAYCLLNNHFHISIRTKTEEEQRAYYEANKTVEISETATVAPPFGLLAPSQQFSNMFNSYAKAINNGYGRTGSLFENKFGRKSVLSDAHFHNLIVYIHRNPQRHGLVADFRDWPWSSYNAILSDKPTRLDRAMALEWFSGREQFRAAHEIDPDEKLIAYLIEDDV
jgi:putative transposase